MTEPEAAVIRAAADLVHHWHTTGRASANIRVGTARLIDLEDKLADAIHEWAGDDGVHIRHEQ